MKRQKSLVEAVLMSFGSTVGLPKTKVALTSQCLATANNVLHCFGVHPTKSADCIPIRQAHSVQVPPYRSMPCVDRNCHF